MAIAIVGSGSGALAFEGPSPGAASASTLKLPDGPASVRGLADSPSVDLFTGQVGYSVPIELPAGPGGLTPKLSFQYSGDLGNGVLGVGWSIGSIMIRRSERHGVPTYDDVADELDLTGVGGGGRLVHDPDHDGQFWVEGKGTSIRVVRHNARFEVTDSAGVKYFLGNSSASREEQDGSHTSAWMVDWVRDIAGNEIDYGYVKAQNHLYLSTIDWGPKIAGVAIFGVTFAYEARPDDVISYRTGSLISTESRVKTVSVRSFSHTLRAYALTYDQTFALSRLQRIEMTGLDGVLSLPALTFRYGQPQRPDAVPMAAVSGWVLNERGVTLTDVDGDGMADLLRLEQGNHQYRQGRGNFYGEPRALSGASDIDLESSSLIDLDGDARPELVHIVDDSWRAFRLVGQSWQSMGPWPGTTGVPLHGADVVLADLNGDGRTDVIRPRGSIISVAFGGATGLGPFVQHPAISSANLEVSPGNANVRFLDMNGDGLADVVWLTDAWMKIFLGRGDGTFVPFAKSPYPWAAAAIDVSKLILADLNRDGLTDLIRIDGVNARWFRGETDGRFEKFFRQLPRPETSDADVVITVADVNGNGSEDVVWSSARGLWALDIAGDTSAGMLESIDNGLGLTTTFTYGSSAALAVAADKSGAPWDKLLPVSVPIPTRFEMDLGDGSPNRVVERSVRDGFWDGIERRFGGFLQGTVTTLGATPATTLVEQTTFHQGLGVERELRGKTVSEQSSSQAGVLFSIDKSTWEALPVAGLTDTPLLRKAALRTVQQFEYEGASTPVELRIDYEFDGEVRPTVEHHLGRVDRTGDEMVIRRVFASDETTWVRDRSISEQTEEASGSIVTASQTYFGGRQGLPLGFGQIGEGFPREVRSFLDVGARWIVQSSKEYDACGNPTRTYQAGVERVVSYDARCLHPVTETITRQPGEPTLAWTMSWEDVQGVPTIATDPNGDTSRALYDELGRPESIFINSATLPHIRYTYDWVAPRPKTTTSVFDGTMAELATQPWPSGSKWRTMTDVSNGAGEALFTTTPLGARLVVEGWKERDERGLVVREAETFYADPSATLPSDARLRSTAYDARARVVLETLPNGATKIISYRPLGKSVATTGLGPMSSELDGLFRIVHTERESGTAVETVDAQYDAIGRLLSMSLQGGEAIHSFSYDTLGRFTHANDPDTGNRDLVYDDANFLVQFTNGEGQTLYFDHDDAGRLVRRGETATPSAATDYGFTYDLASAATGAGCHVAARLGAITEPNGEVHLCYDQLGRATGMARTIALPGTPPTSGSVSDEFSFSGLLLTEAFDDGFATAYRYDAAGRPVAISSDGRDLWVADGTDDLDGAGRVVNERYGNSATETYAYDALGLASHIKLTPPSSSASLYEVSVTRNEYGAPTIVTDLDHQGLDQSATFSYDAAGRLKSATLGPVGPDQFSFSYAYDALQNMTSRGATGPHDIGVLTGVYKYGERGYGPRQLTSVIP